MSPPFLSTATATYNKGPFTFNAQLSLQDLSFFSPLPRLARAPPSPFSPAANGLCAPWNIQREIARTLKTLKIKISVKRLAWGSSPNYTAMRDTHAPPRKRLIDLRANTISCNQSCPPIGFRFFFSSFFSPRLSAAVQYFLLLAPRPVLGCGAHFDGQKMIQIRPLQGGGQRKTKKQILSFISVTALQSCHVVLINHVINPRGLIGL